MGHPRKKGGERKDKKVERMRKDVALRHAEAQPPHPTTDQVDVIDYKPGGPDDSNRQHRANQ